MAYTLSDLTAVETQIAQMQTAKRLGDLSINYDTLDKQLLVRDAIIRDLHAQGITVPGAPSASPRPRVYRINTGRGL
jgi:hypothetical protein